jgi:hypothetical protein
VPRRVLGSRSFSTAGPTADGLRGPRGKGPLAELDTEVRELLEEVAGTLHDEAVEQHPDLRVSAISDERVRASLEHLVEMGLIVPRGRVEALAEELAQERLRALRQEHSVA